MKTVDRLKLAAMRLEDSGFGCDAHTAAALARAFASSTVPLRAFLAWLERTPEAAELLGDTGPAAPQPPQVSRPERAKISEPQPPGVAGVSIPSVTVTNEDAAAALAALNAPNREQAIKNLADVCARGFQTRPISPEDVSAEGLGVTTVSGLVPVNDPETGKPLVAVVRVGRREIACEFFDRRGAMLLARPAGNARASILNVCEMHIEPSKRAAVRAALGEPDANEFNFNPFDNMPDAWPTN